MILNHDIHVHTYLSACCAEKETHRPSNILKVAEKMGTNTIGFSDHLWVNDSINPGPWYAAQGRNQIEKLSKDLAEIETTVDVLVGCETDMYGPDIFGMTRDFAEKLDFVLLPHSHFHMTEYMRRSHDNSCRGLAADMLEFFRAAVTSGIATSIAHPFSPCIEMDSWDGIIDSIADAELSDVFALAAEHNVAMEITVGNYPPQKADGSGQTRWSLETPVRFLTLAREAGCKFTLGTDAHSLEKLERLPELSGLAEAAGITDDHILRLDQ